MSTVQLWIDALKASCLPLTYRQDNRTTTKKVSQDLVNLYLLESLHTINKYLTWKTATVPRSGHQNIVKARHHVHLRNREAGSSLGDHWEDRKEESNGRKRIRGASEGELEKWMGKMCTHRSGL